MLKISRKESFSESEIQEIEKLSDEIKNFSENRNIKNNLDMDFIKNEVFKT
jgi:hypothetical protein